MSCLRYDLFATLCLLATEGNLHRTCCQVSKIDIKGQEKTIFV